MSYSITTYQDQYRQSVINLILPIQQEEFKVPITVNDQPDLQSIHTFYQKGKGNFWVATKNNEVVGTIALIDIGNDQTALRKMFVHRDHRGKDKGVAQLLMDELVLWCRQQGVKDIFLGTIDSMHAAHRFYLKNSFVEVKKTELPQNFPVMKVDNRFFKCKLN